MKSSTVSKIFHAWKARMPGPVQWPVLTSLSLRFCRRNVLQSAHWMSDSRLHRGHVAGQQPISGVILPWRTRSAGRQEVRFNFQKQQQSFLSTFKFDYCLTIPVLQLTFRVTVARVTRMSEGCQIELRLIVLAITEKDAGTELRCVTQNQAGRQEVVTHLQLEGKTIMQLFGVFFLNFMLISVCHSCWQTDMVR